MNYYHYMTKDGSLIRIKNRQKPHERCIPNCGTWKLMEYDKELKAWVMPAFPEIQMAFIGKNLIYLGSVKAENQNKVV